MQYDVFNGDADGICALHQLRMADPKPDAELITGVKRDIKLLGRLTELAAADDHICVLDISMATNMESLNGLLTAGCKVFYADHHFAGEIPNHANLTAKIDASPEVCTSLIINSLLENRFLAWAVAAAFGDNLHGAAKKAAASLALSEKQMGILREIGELINYNGYGGVLEDLHFTPDSLFMAIQPFESPFDFYHESEVLQKLRNGFKSDMEKALSEKSYKENERGRLFMFPAQAWSKRVAGVFSNEKAREMPDAAHALMVDNGNGTYLVSVRAPINNRVGADELCRAFPTGGGRAAAAGINELPVSMLDNFTARFYEVF